ncbi:MAG: hypothetical protein GY811_21995 [Myxococcales bacterium]|nr:hypothetical protein [Myxococcales bacterium]
MGAIAGIFRSGIEGLVGLFDLLGPFLGLSLLSILSGIGMLWVVGKTTPQKVVERARNRMDSAVYEIRLFIDSPKRVVISLGRLLSNSLLYIVAMLPAFVILAVPLAFIYLSLDARHGREAIPVNEPFVVSVQLADGVDGRKVSFTANAGIEITSPPLYVQSKQAVYVRAVAMRPVDATIFVDLGGRAVTKRIVADPNAEQMAPDRASGIDLFFSYGPEDSLDGRITGISVPHATKDGRYLGINMPWWIWWLVLMMIAAFGLRKPMGVTL